MAASPPPYREPKRQRKCYVTPTFSGIPNAKPGEQNQKLVPNKGNKIRSGCLTLAFSGAQKRAKMPHHPAFSGIPNAKRGEKNQKRLAHPYILGGPQTRGQNQKGPRRGDKIKSGYITTSYLGFPIASNMNKRPSAFSLCTNGACQLSPFPNPSVTFGELY